VWRRIVSRSRGLPAQPENDYAGQLVYTANRRAWIIDRRRHRAQRDVDNLNDPKLDILLQRPGWAHVQSAKEVKFALRRHPLRLRYPDDRNAGGDEMANPALQMHANAILSGEADQAIDISDVPRLPAEDCCALFA
jgi:hypothetical protein